MNTQIGFDLKNTKHYGSAEMAQKQVEKALAGLIAQGVSFNILIVQQRRGGMGTDAEDLRFIPLLSCFRVAQGAQFVAPAAQAAFYAAQAGFTAFA